MNAILCILRRELGAYLRTPMGTIILAAVLCIDGLLFNAFAVGAEQRASTQALEVFFYCTSGTTVLASIFIAMRLIAEERQNGTLVLLSTAPIRDWQVVVGKFAAAWLYLALLTALTLPMPALIHLYGKVAWGHIAAGYLGLMLIGGAALALGMLCSALAPNQLVAAILGAATVTGFILLWRLASIASPPLDGIVAYLALHDRHFRPFMHGLIATADLVFYLSLIYVALVATTRALEARRWR